MLLNSREPNQMNDSTINILFDLSSSYGLVDSYLPQSLLFSACDATGPGFCPSLAVSSASTPSHGQELLGA